ncbi:DUF4160 domain-containing protein [Clostridium gasigenes]|uniref:DUF4160 domain-containing protein n=1 Tax=Clostridium gasigenes TaxID=94869 RepID=UPI001C0D14BE|nr:DUF4160 domain-containing protein [Clostridium gasigenes]MBU3137834.1 DUF4160 domain-containing protein [Clostridium gasigenes]
MELKDENLDFNKLGMILLGRTTFARIAKVKGLRFEIRPKENGHNDPHCHVSYQGRNISISLTNFNILEGNLPHKQQREASEWIIGNIGILKQYWNEYHEIVVS